MANRLADSTSPYLFQHADNPVEWYPWSEEVFEKARAEDKPILLSVGYSSCHWCHVMAHESFEDAETARLMNELFVNVKVDREERPDVDAIYMEAVHALTGHGGWPMTVFLTPEGKPFFAGTYFPKDERPGLPSFQRVLTAIAETWQQSRGDIERQASKVVETIARRLEPASALPGRAELERAYLHVQQSFDPEHGGFGTAPKFPQEPTLEFLLRSAGEEWAPDAEWLVGHTLEHMARGGIYDHVGGGFARYSVDQAWLIPHFEKMLYDNAQLARLYVRAWQVLDTDRFRWVAIETLEYLLRDLRHPEGGLYSAEDADSEGREGKFYVWSVDEFREVVGPDDAPVAEAYFGVTEAGNFEGANHLHEAAPIDEVAESLGIEPAEAKAAIERAKAGLFDQRCHRIRPGLDDKVVTSWNGLALRALADAGAVLGDEEYLEAGRANARFVLANLVGPGGRLMRSWRQGKTSVPGFLDDYASYAVGLFALYQATGELEWYRQGMKLVEEFIGLFEDPDGGFFSTGHDAEELVTRPKDQMDNPLPSGNSLAAEALLMAWLYTGEDRYRSRAEATIRAGGRLIDAYPTAVGHLLSVVHAMAKPPKEVAITGPEAHDLAGAVWERFLPHIALAIDLDGSAARAVPILEDRYQSDRTLAYVCENFVCQVPVETKEELRARL
jgi:uncharacterized protein YyaL (SSP411 family)